MSDFAKTFHPEPEPERYEFRAGSFHHFELPRRDFFKVLGAGIAVFAVAQDAAALQESGRQRGRGEELPREISAWLHIPPQISAFLGGTGLLIVVSVALDMVQRIEANLLMRNYSGFLGGPGHKGKRIKGRQY